MSYMKGYNTGRYNRGAERQKTVKSALSVKRNVLGRFLDWVTGNSDTNRDGRISPEEYHQAVVIRDKVLAELEAGANYLGVLSRQWGNAAIDMGGLHAEITEIVYAYNELETIAPTIWAEFPGIGEVYDTHLEPQVAEIVAEPSYYQTRFDAIGETLVEMMEAFQRQIDITYDYYAEMGIKSLYHPFARIKLTLDKDIKEVKERLDEMR